MGAGDRIDLGIPKEQEETDQSGWRGETQTIVVLEGAARSSWRIWKHQARQSHGLVSGHGRWKRDR